MGLRISRKKSIVALVFAPVIVFAALVGNSQWHNARVSAAFGGSFVYTVTPDPSTSILSGDQVRYRVDYSCSVSACNDVVLTLAAPTAAYIASNGTVTNDTSTASNAFSGSDAVWTFKPSIAAGTAGTLYASWNTKNYLTPNGTQLTATATAASGSESLPPVTSAPITVSATAHWLMKKSLAPNQPTPLYMSNTFGYNYMVNVIYDSTQPQFGRLALQDLSIVDQLPAGSTFVSASDGGVYNAASHTVTWTISNNDAVSNVQGGVLGGPSMLARHYFGNGNVGGYTVTVTYPPANFTSGDTVTNVATYNAHGYGDTTTPLTGTDDDVKTLTDIGTTTIQTNKGLNYYGARSSYQVTPGDSIDWYFPIDNIGTTNITGTVKDILPCVDDVAATLYVTNFATTSCTPSDTIDTLRIQYVKPGAKITTLRWRTNLGTTGTYTPTFTGSGNWYLPVASLGIPSGELLLGIEYDYEIPAAAGGSGVMVMLSGKAGLTLNEGDVVRNTMEETYSDGTTTRTGTYSNQYTSRAKAPTVQTDIRDVAGSSSSYLPGQQITWEAKYIDYARPYGDNANATPDWYITVPSGLQYIEGSVNYTDLANIGGVQPELVETIAGTGNLAGSSILHLRWPTSAYINGYTLNSTWEQRPIAIQFKTIVKPAYASGVYSATPPNSGSPASATSNGIASAAYAVGHDTLGVTYPIIVNEQKDVIDFDNDANLTELMAQKVASWSVSPGATAYTNIAVSGGTSAAYGATGHTAVQGAAHYQIDLLNGSNDGTSLKNMVFYQTLPRVNDTYISTNSGQGARGSQYDVFLTGPVTVPAGTTAYYSTATNPCMPEVVTGGSGCTNDWTTTITDWSQVTAVKYVLSGTYAPNTGAQVMLPVTTSATATPGQIAYTSVAFAATNAATNNALVPAESARVALMVDPYAFTVQKTASPSTTTPLVKDDVVTYSVTLTHAGAAAMDLSAVTLTDDLTDVLSYSSVVSGSLQASSALGNTAAAPTIAGSTLHWSGALKQGDTITLTYKVKINAMYTATMKNAVTANGTYNDTTSAGSNCTLGTETGCTVTNTLVTVSATDDSASGPLNTPVPLSPLLNDNAGPGSFVPSSLVFVTPPAGTTLSTDGKTLTIPNQGTYTIDSVSGGVTFTPVQGFSGIVTPVDYQVASDLGSGKQATTSAVLHVTIAPASTTDKATTPYGVPVTIDVTTNDGVDKSNIKKIELYDPATSTYGTTLTTTDGTYKVLGLSIVFTPRDGFSGQTSPITYRLTDNADQTTLTTVTVTVLAAETTQPSSPTLVDTGSSVWAVAAIGLLFVGASVSLYRRARS